jgi:1-acyl-sn-glycerol-3-phosphate acyltransferase
MESARLWTAGCYNDGGVNGSVYLIEGDHMTASGFSYDPMPDLDRPFVERLSAFPRQPDILQYAVRMAVNVCIRAYLRSYHRLTIVGKENLPAEGSFVMVANHSSHLDALCLLAALPLGRLHRTFPAAAADYFFVSMRRTAIAVLAVNALPFYRRVNARHSIAICRELLAIPGNTLILFPEGTRSHDSKLGPFKPGIGKVLAGSNVPAIPCYLDGAGRAWPKGRRIPMPRPIRLIIGTPRTYAGLGDDKPASQFICQDLHNAVSALANESSSG